MVSAEALPNDMVKLTTIDPLGRAPVLSTICPMAAWVTACGAPVGALLPFGI